MTQTEAETFVPGDAMAPTEREVPKSGFRLSIAIKVILIAIIPIIAMAVLNLVSSNQTNTLFLSTLSFVEKDIAETASLSQSQKKIAGLTNRLKEEVSSIAQAQQGSILMKNLKAAGKVRVKRGKVGKLMESLGGEISAFQHHLIEAGHYSEENSSDTDKRRMNFLIRRASNLPRQFKMYHKSGDRTFALITRRKFEDAANNLRFEENFRLAPVLQSVTRIASELEDFLTDMQAREEAVRNKRLADALAGADAQANRNTVILSIGTIALVILAILFSVYGLSRRLQRLSRTMITLGTGDTSVDVPKFSGDEIGDMSGTVQIFKDNLLNMEKLRADQILSDKRVEEGRIKAEAQKKQSEETAQADRRAQMIKLADGFEASVLGVVENVSKAANEMQGSANSMSTSAQDMNNQAESAASTSQQTSINVQNVASAAEQLSKSVTEISRQVSLSTEVANSAAEEAEKTNGIVLGLSSSAQKIGDVVSLINDIAEQTNLLALNATIEAARAGDAGKGFAVVASEVKNLATQTAKATEEISSQISEMQTETEGTVEAIQHIGETISKINEYAAAISGAVEEQGAATQEISRNIQDASKGTEGVSANIEVVTKTATDTGEAASDVLQAAESLTVQSTDLEKQVSQFVVELRSG